MARRQPPPPARRRPVEPRGPAWFLASHAFALDARPPRAAAVRVPVGDGLHRRSARDPLCRPADLPRPTVRPRRDPPRADRARRPRAVADGGARLAQRHDRRDADPWRLSRRRVLVDQARAAGRHLGAHCRLAAARHRHARRPAHRRAGLGAALARHRGRLSRHGARHRAEARCCRRLLGPPVTVCFLGTVSITLGTIWQKRTAAAVDLRTNAVAQFVGAALATLPVALILENGRLEPAPELFIGLTWSVVALSIGAIGLLLVLIRSGAVARVAALFYLVPPVAALMAYFLFGETLSPVQILGMLVAFDRRFVDVAPVPRNVRRGRRDDGHPESPLCIRPHGSAFLGVATIAACACLLGVTF